MTPDGELLRRYTETNSETAFAELVERHLALVYAAALRQVNGDAHLAQDVAQTVFADLARKAASLAGRPVLTGWLYTSAHFAAAKAVRTERRRHTREEEAQLMNQLLCDPAPDLDWEKLRPVLDAAMLELNETDREAVLLRYFDNRPHAEIADRLGLSENAARMRVDRALEKLRTLLVHRGLSTTAALSAVISANAVQVAPAGLAVTISTGAALAGTTLATTATATATKAIAMTTLQKTLVTVSIVAASLATPLLIQHQSQIRLRAENETLRQQVAQLGQPATESIAAPPVASTTSSPALSNDQFTELLRLRGEVGVLRGQASEIRKLEEDNRRLRNALLAGANPAVSHGQRADAPGPPLNDIIMPRGSISWRAVNVNQALHIYSVLANTEIDADEQVRRLRVGLAFTNSEAVTRTEAIRLLEGVFHDQAAIETTHPETNRTVFRLR